jgi:hypothetical protein
MAILGATRDARRTDSHAASDATTVRSTAVATTPITVGDQAAAVSDGRLVASPSLFRLENFRGVHAGGSPRG